VGAVGRDGCGELGDAVRQDTDLTVGVTWADRGEP
jgi:hypothetical protein